MNCSPKKIMWNQSEKKEMNKPRVGRKASGYGYRDRTKNSQTIWLCPFIFLDISIIVSILRAIGVELKDRAWKSWIGKAGRLLQQVSNVYLETVCSPRTGGPCMTRMIRTARVVRSSVALVAAGKRGNLYYVSTIAAAKATREVVPQPDCKHCYYCSNHVYFRHNLLAAIQYSYC